MINSSLDIKCARVLHLRIISFYYFTIQQTLDSCGTSVLYSCSYIPIIHDESCKLARERTSKQVQGNDGERERDVAKFPIRYSLRFTA